MFFIQKLKLLHEKIVLPQIFLPVIITVIAILTIIFTFIIFAQRVIFIYDPYTIKISGYNISQIKRTGIRNHVFVKPIETKFEDFHKIYENLSEKEKEKKIIISAYLYSMLKDNEEYKLFFNNSNIYIYGPLFDYEQNDDPISVSTSISNKTKISYFFRESRNLVFFIPEPIYRKANTIEPESTLISLLTENFDSLENNGNVVKMPLSDNVEKSTLVFENDAIIVLCLRKISTGIKSLITESEGKVIFFDYINNYNLRNSFNFSKEASFSASLSYDYKDTLDKIFKIMGENSEKGINYVAVFSFFQKRM
ncbi:MAG: hypothetical protein FWE72_03125 [Spirochaetaceae bacterium]|nr:hypothetical protein [Spirochaetaceae bacterium]